MDECRFAFQQSMTKAGRQLGKYTQGGLSRGTQKTYRESQRKQRDRSFLSLAK